MDRMVVKAVSRKETGKRAAHKLRKAGQLPAVMYNAKGVASSLVVDEADFSKVWRLSTPTTIIDLIVDDQAVGIAFIKATEFDIKTDRNLHVDFQVIEADAILRKTMKVQFTGTPTGVREGGRLSAHNTQVAIRCLPKDLPVRIVADIASLGIGSSFKVKDLGLDKNVTVVTDPESALVSVLSAN